jgi:hypothetical protein
MSVQHAAYSLQLTTYSPAFYAVLARQITHECFAYAKIVLLTVSQLHFPFFLDIGHGHDRLLRPMTEIDIQPKQQPRPQGTFYYSHSRSHNDFHYLSFRKSIMICTAIAIAHNKQANGKIATPKQSTWQKRLQPPLFNLYCLPN